MKLSSLAALKKSNGKIRGIASGECIRRIVAKILVRQFNDSFRSAVSPTNFGLSNPSNTDSLVHFIQLVSELNPNIVVSSIDGIGAFDHASRASFFQELHDNANLQQLNNSCLLYYCGTRMILSSFGLISIMILMSSNRAMAENKAIP